MKTSSLRIVPLVASALVLIAGAPAVCKADSAQAVSLFDGKTLDGWIDQENSAGGLSTGDIKDFAAFAKKLNAKSDPISAFLNDKLEAAAKTDLASYSDTNDNAKAVRSAVVKSLNKILADGSIYDEARFKDVQLSSDARELLARKPQGAQAVRLNKLLLEDAYPADLTKSPATGWIVKDGAIASTGAGRGTLYTKGDYGHYRLTFLMRHVSGKPDHQACVLIFCTRPKEGEKPLDAIGGIQFQVPNGGHWDYRPGFNKGNPNNEFTNVVKPQFNIHEWSQVEIVADASTGTARMAVAQPPGGKAIEVLDFKDPAAGKVGPIALQMHNGGLFDEYKDIKIEVEPKDNELATTK